MIAAAHDTVDLEIWDGGVNLSIIRREVRDLQFLQVTIIVNLHPVVTVCTRLTAPVTSLLNEHDTMTGQRHGDKNHRCLY